MDDIPVPVKGLLPAPSDEPFDEHAIRDAKGRLTKRHPGGAPIYTSETARNGHVARRQKLEMAVRKRLVEHGKVLYGEGIRTPQDVLGTAAADLFVQVVANKEAHPRDRRQTLETVLDVAGFAKEKDADSGKAHGNRLTMEFTDSGLRAVLGALSGSRGDSSDREGDS